MNGKDIETKQDLIQEIILNIIENNYIIEKNTFLIVSKYLYNKVIKHQKLEKISIDNEGEKIQDFLNLLSFQEWENKKILIENTETEKQKDIVKALDLTPKQTEILDIFSKTYNLTKTAELLGITKTRVFQVMQDIRKKYDTLVIKMA